MARDQWLPITPDEFADILDDLEERWGTLHKSWGDGTKSIAHFEAFPAQIVQRAVASYFNEGKQTPPSTAAIRGRALEGMKASGRPLDTVGPCQHLSWAILDEYPDGRRVVVCANQECREERTVNRGEVSTAGERGELTTEIF